MAQVVTIETNKMFLVKNQKHCSVSSRHRRQIKILYHLHGLISMYTFDF